MNISKSEAHKPKTFTKSGLQNSRFWRYIRYFRYIIRGTAICVVVAVVILCYWLFHTPAKSEECVDFCRLFDIRLTSGLENLMQGESETIIVVDNKLKADMIILCKSYSDVSYSKLRESGISDRTAKKIDIPHFAEGAHYYLLKDSKILCKGYTVKADLVSTEIIAKVNDKIRFTLIPNPNSHDFQKIRAEAQNVPIDSINHAMIIADVK